MMLMMKKTGKKKKKKKKFSYKYLLILNIYTHFLSPSLFTISPSSSYFALQIDFNETYNDDDGNPIYFDPIRSK